MNDLFLFGGILLFFFVLWVYAGGPNNPISFAGPYITPITAPGVVQTGYGDAGDGDSFWSSWGDNPVISTAESPYAGKVHIGGGNPEAKDEQSEYLIISTDSSTDITITGWQLVRASNGAQVRIPEGARTGSKRAVRISNDELALIITGSRAGGDLRGSYSDAWRVYLGKDREIWRNTGDTITLLDDAGKVVDQYEY